LRINLLNRIFGLPNQTNAACIDEIPSVGPIEISIDCAAAPQRVALGVGAGKLTWDFTAGILSVRLEQVSIHTVICGEGVVER
jgi:hypothetical protein